MKTLELQRDGQYRAKTNKSEVEGKWMLVDASHLSLENVDYRFFFKGKNLVLQDEKGQQYEYQNSQQKSGEPPGQINGRLSQFIRRIFQDKNGDLWFGTNGDGVIRYNGDTLEYFSLEEGFGGVAVRGIVEDTKGNVWFATEGGLTVYDGKSFTNLTEKDGLIHNDAWSIMIDRYGKIWIGTLGGACIFDGEVFTHFEMPEAEADPTRGVTSTKIVHSIMEDRKGNIWFGTNGGAYIFDGKTLSNFNEADGLCNNAVNCILEDRQGNIWFATHHNGICIWDKNSFSHLSESQGIRGTEVWDLYADGSDNIWFPTEGFGVYRYDGQSYTNFHEQQGMYSRAIQCTFQDKDGVIWSGGYNGLFRYNGQSFTAATREFLLTAN